MNGINSIPSKLVPPTSSSVCAFKGVPISVLTTSALALSVSQPFGTSMTMSEFGSGLGLSAVGDFAMDVDDGEVRISSFDTAAQNGKGKRRAADEDERGSREAAHAWRGPCELAEAC